MIIIKKSGKKEDYSADKLSRSVLAASDEAAQPLSESDVKRILTDFQQLVSGKERMTSQQITVIMNGILYSRGYHGVLQRYASHKK